MGTYEPRVVHVDSENRIVDLNAIVNDLVRSRPSRLLPCGRPCW